MTHSLAELTKKACTGLLAAALAAFAPAVLGNVIVSKTFSPTSVSAGNTSTLTITITGNPPPGNPGNISFTDTYPANLTNATPANVTNTCGGTASTPATNQLRLSGTTTLTGSGTCTVTVQVTSCTVGTYNNSVTVNSVSAGSASASASLTVTAAAVSASQSTVTASPTSVAADGTTTSTITVTLRDGCGNAVSGKAVSLSAGSGSSTISPASATTNASGVATFTVRDAIAETVTYTATDTTDAVTIAQTAAVTFTRITAPTVSKSFSPTSITVGGSSTLTVTIANPNTASITGVAFTDNYPANLTNSATPNLTFGNCGGGATITGAANGTSLSLSGGTIAGGATCTISITVTSATMGSYNNSTGAVTSNNANSGAAASATLTVNGTAPTVSKSFNPTSIAAGASSTLTVTITNPNASAISSVAFTDSYPSGLTNAATPNLTSSGCGGATITGNANGTSLSMSGGSIAASGTCQISVNVTSTAMGSYNNSTGTVTSSNAATATAASATLTVTGAAPTVSKSFNPTSITTGGSSTLTVTIANGNTAAITGVAFTDTYPAGLTNGATTNLTSTNCGGGAIVTGAANGTSLSLSGGNIASGATCTISITVTSGTVGSYNNSTGTITSTNAANGTAASATLTVTAGVASFNVVQPGAGPTGVIFTKIAGQDIAVDILALNGSGAITAFTGTVKVELVDNSSLGACGTLPNIKTLSDETFTAGNAGRHPLSSGQFEANAYRNVKFRISFPTVSPTVTTCSSDAFANRPASFNVLVRDANPDSAGTTRTLNNTANPGSGVVHTAGRPFRIDATAVNGAGTPVTTSLYSPPSGQPVAVLSQCGGGVPVACVAPSGTLTATWATSAGVVTSTDAAYTEVGSFDLVLQDQTFSDVDALDGSTQAQRYVQSSAVTVGRFVPASFTISASALTNRDGLGCSPASSFSYMGEGITLTMTLQANRHPSGVTQNYAGSLATVNPSVAAAFGFGARSGATNLTARVSGTTAGTWSSGSVAVTGVLRILRNATPDGRYAALQFGIAPVDSDGVTMGTFDLDVDGNAANDHTIIGGATEVRFGRLRQQNAIASSGAIVLPVPIALQYWDGSVFRTNTDDSCTTLAVGNVTLSGATFTPAGSTSVQSVSFTAGTGAGFIRLAAPGAGNGGFVLVTPTVPSYLQGDWTGAAWDQNPTNRASWGVFASQPQNFIFQRENY